MRELGFRPATPITDGIARLVQWYRGGNENGRTEPICVVTC